jgi:uncharacterized protein YaiL (DUF2058 family)
MTDIVGSTAVAAVGGGGAFAAVWHGIKWSAAFISGRIDKREATLNAREARMDEEEAAQVKQLRADVAALKAWQETAIKELADHRMLLGIFIAKVAKEEPTAPELMIARKVLGTAFPLYAIIPEDMAGLLDTLDMKVKS